MLALRQPRTARAHVVNRVLQPHDGHALVLVELDVVQLDALAVDPRRQLVELLAGPGRPQRQRRGRNSGTSMSSVERAARVTRGSASGTRTGREPDCGFARVSGWSA